MMSVAVYSKIYLESTDDSWTCRPTRAVVERLHARDEETSRWIAVLGGIRIALGDPVIGGGGSARDRSLYIPQWILDSAGIDGDGDEISVRFEKAERFAKATKLGFKVMGEIPEGIDLKDLLEEPLSQLAVLEEGQIIPAPVLEGIHLLVQTCEPAGQPVLLDGAEVGLEIEEDDEVIGRRQREAEEALAAARRRAEEEAIAAAALAEAQKKAEEEKLAAAPMAPPVTARSLGRFAQRPPSGYVPFGGVGRRLCD